METILCHVDQDKFIVLNCPKCQHITRVSVSKFQNKKHKLTTRCKCNHRFQTQLNFRKYYRKNVNIAGEVVFPSANNGKIRKLITVSDLSMSGLRFKMVDEVKLQAGNLVRVTFDLATKQPTTIRKEAIIRFSDNDHYGCEFKELDLQEKDLGFFLFAQ